MQIMPNLFKRNTTCVFEILMSGLLTDLGLRLLFSPGIITNSNMAVVLNTMSVEVLSVLCFTIGLSRCYIMLFETTFGRYNIWIRLALTVMSGFIWGAFVTGFFETFYLQNRPLPPGFDMLLTQAIGEFVVALQLAKEIR